MTTGAIGRTTGEKVFSIINSIVLILIIIVTILPILNIIIVSFSTIQDVMRPGFHIFPTKFVITAYKFVLSQGGIGRAYNVTIYITVIGTLVNLLLTAFGGYVLSHKDLPLRGFFNTLVIISMIFSGGLIPLYMVVKNLHLINRLWSLILPTGINTFYLILMRNFFQSIPRELIESARIDGCSEAGVMFRIVFPLSKAIFATLGLFYAVGHWNEYFRAILFINKADLQPLQVIIRSMYQGGADLMRYEDNLPPPTETVKAATIVVTTVPILCIYPYLQKYFSKGVMLGAIKG